MIACVLAAGSSQRFGSCKALFNLNGKPMIQHVLDSLPHGLEKYVVTGAFKNDIENYLRSQKIGLIYNPNHNQGMGTSIAKAAEKAIDLNTDLLLTFCDLPYVTSIDYKSLLENFNGKPLFSEFDQIIAPPAIFPKDQLKPLHSLNSDQGAKKLYNDYQTIPLPNAGRDIDSII